MSAPGLIGLVQLAIVLTFALPALLFGIDRLAAGNLALGWAFIALGILMLVTERYLTNPLDPGDLLESALGRLRRGKD